MTNGFVKVYGAEAAQDGIIVLSEKNCVIFYGYGTDELGGWNWRKDYDHIPTVAEVRADIEALVNTQIDAAILTGLRWNGKPVYLSSENQFNFKAAHDLAEETDGAILPIKFKLGEDENGDSVYHTFTKTETLADFVSSIFVHIQGTIKAGWTEKDSIDYSLYQVAEP